MMNRSPRRRHPLRVLLLGLLMVATLSAPVHAAADDPVDPTADDGLPAIALRLSPAVLEIPGGPGPSRHELRVDNLGSRPLTVVTQLSDFTVTDDGTTRFLGPDAISATAWASLDVDTFRLGPGERRDVTLTVEVPDDAEPGERYLSAIFAVPGDPDSTGNISVTHRVAVKLYIDVAGERIEHLELGELSGPRLIDTGPATFALTVNNRGNVHRRFEEGSRLLATNGDTDFAFENFTVLGDSTRVVEASWPDPPLVCWCTVEVEIDDGRGGLVLASTRVIAFPLRLSLALLALTVGLAILSIGRRRHRAAKRDGHRVRPADPQSPRESPPAPATQPSDVDLFVPPAPTPTATVTTQRTPPRAESQGLDTRMFTAHGTHGRQRRRGR